MATYEYRCLISLLFLFLAGCSAPARFSYYNPKASPEEIASLLERVEQIEKEDFKNIRIETLADHKRSSHHLVVVRDEEPLHYHAKHDGWVLVLKGEADFLLGDVTRVLRPGSSVYIPRGVRHRAVRRSGKTIAAFVIFTPAYDGKDFIPVEET